MSQVLKSLNTYSLWLTLELTKQLMLETFNLWVAFLGRYPITFPGLYMTKPWYEYRSNLM
jgi:hypothetical protein